MEQKDFQAQADKICDIIQTAAKERGRLRKHTSDKGARRGMSEDQYPHSADDDNDRAKRVKVATDLGSANMFLQTLISRV